MAGFGGVSPAQLHDRSSALVAPPPYDRGRLRFNDGKVDPAGRLWIGSISDAREPEAALYRFDGRAFAAQVSGLTTSNGLAWSPDGRRMHWSDTKAHRIYVADFDVATAALSNPRVFAEFKPRAAGEGYGGRPDGAAMDAEVMLRETAPFRMSLTKPS